MIKKLLRLAGARWIAGICGIAAEGLQNLRREALKTPLRRLRERIEAVLVLVQCVPVPPVCLPPLG